MKAYNPELGQMMFGQPHKEYAASRLLIAALESISSQLDRAMWNRHQEEYASPFNNTGSSFKCNTVEV